MFSSYIPSIGTTRRTDQFHRPANPGPRTSELDHHHSERLQPVGLRRDELAAPVRLLELRLLPPDGNLGGAGEQHRPDRSIPAAPPTPTRCAPMPAPSIRSPSAPSAAIGRPPPSWWSAPVTATSSTTPNSAEPRSGTRYVYSEHASTPPRLDLAGQSVPSFLVQHVGLRQHPEQPGHRRTTPTSARA